jgi:hypothetical protein
MVNLPRHALATIELFLPEDGGRKGPLLALPWRVDIRIGNETRMYYSARVDIEEVLRPGEIRRVYLAFGRPELVGSLLEPGTQIFYCAGRAVGKGEILALYLSDDERRGNGGSLSDYLSEREERDRDAVVNVRKALEALLERRISLTEGVRNVLQAAADARSIDGSLLRLFTGVESELQHFPVGEVRQ